MMTRPELKNYNTGGSMVAPYGLPDYEAYSKALDAYIDAQEAVNKNALLHDVSVSVCCKCQSDDIDIKFMPQRTNVPWSSHNTIKNIKNFTRNDSYYYNDMVIKECLIHTCKKCGFKEAVSTER